MDLSPLDKCFENGPLRYVAAFVVEVPRNSFYIYRKSSTFVKHVMVGNFGSVDTKSEPSGDGQAGEK